MTQGPIGWGPGANKHHTARLVVVTRTDGQQMLRNEDAVRADATAADVTITLPAIADYGQGRMLYAACFAGAFDLILDGSGAETINGAATLTVGAAGTSAILVATGATTWERIN